MKSTNSLIKRPVDINQSVKRLSNLQSSSSGEPRRPSTFSSKDVLPGNQQYLQSLTTKDEHDLKLREVFSENNNSYNHCLSVDSEQSCPSNKQSPKRRTPYATIHQTEPASQQQKMASSAKCINDSMLKYQNMLLQDVIKENKGLRQTLQKTEKDARQLQGMKSQLFEKDRLIYRLQSSISQLKTRPFCEQQSLDCQVEQSFESRNKKKFLKTQQLTQNQQTPATQQYFKKSPKLRAPKNLGKGYRSAGASPESVLEQAVIKGTRKRINFVSPSLQNKTKTKLYANKNEDLQQQMDNFKRKLTNFIGNYQSCFAAMHGKIRHQASPSKGTMCTDRTDRNNAV